MKILCIGHSSYDITLPVPEYPAEDKKYRITSSVRSGGGPAANAAYLLGKWGMDTSFAGTIGYDSYGNEIKKEFKSVNVDTTYLETNYDGPTTTSFILINEQSGSRTLFNVTDEYRNIKKPKIDMVPNAILVDGHEFEASKFMLDRNPNAITLIDAGRATKEVIELCKMVKYIVCSREFAESVTGLKIDYANPQTLANVYLQLKEKFKNALEISITLEKYGVLYVYNNAIKMLPALKVETKDTTGAGDIFHGAFMYGLANEFDYEKTVKIANIAAGLSVTKIGSRLSIPTVEEVLDYYEKH